MPENHMPAESGKSHGQGKETGIGTESRHARKFEFTPPYSPFEKLSSIYPELTGTLATIHNEAAKHDNTLTPYFLPMVVLNQIRDVGARKDTFETSPLLPFTTDELEQLQVRDWREQKELIRRVKLYFHEHPQDDAVVFSIKPSPYPDQQYKPGEEKGTLSYSFDRKDIDDLYEQTHYFDRELQRLHDLHKAAGKFAQYQRLEPEEKAMFDEYLQENFYKWSYEANNDALTEVEREEAEKNATIFMSLQEMIDFSAEDIAGDAEKLVTPPKQFEFPPVPSSFQEQVNRLGPPATEQKIEDLKRMYPNVSAITLSILTDILEAEKLSIMHEEGEFEENLPKEWRTARDIIIAANEINVNKKAAGQQVNNIYVAPDLQTEGNSETPGAVIVSTADLEKNARALYPFDPYVKALRNVTTAVGKAFLEQQALLSNRHEDPPTIITKKEKETAARYLENYRRYWEDKKNQDPRALENVTIFSSLLQQLNELPVQIDPLEDLYGKPTPDPMERILRKPEHTTHRRKHKKHLARRRPMPPRQKTVTSPDRIDHIDIDRRSKN